VPQAPARARERERESTPLRATVFACEGGCEGGAKGARAHKMKRKPTNAMPYMNAFSPDVTPSGRGCEGVLRVHQRKKRRGLAVPRHAARMINNDVACAHGRASARACGAPRGAPGACARACVRRVRRACASREGRRAAFGARESVREGWRGARCARAPPVRAAARKLLPPAMRCRYSSCRSSCGCGMARARAPRRARRAHAHARTHARTHACARARRAAQRPRVRGCLACPSACACARRPGSTAAALAGRWAESRSCIPCPVLNLEFHQPPGVAKQERELKG
jgi:hypothetical protein